jgi:uncharacterized damage-inducible protein DinB
MRMKLALSIVTAAAVCLAQPDAKPLSPVQQEYMWEFEHAMGQVIALAKAMPADKFGWRPGPGVRSTSEVYMHIASANLMLLHVAGVKEPGGMKTADIPAIRELEKTQTTKAQVLEWLNRSLEAVRKAYPATTPAAQERSVDFFGQKRSVRAVYLRLLVHVDEHMGQAVAYARVNGIAPPWSRQE